MPASKILQVKRAVDFRGMHIDERRRDFHSCGVADEPRYHEAVHTVSILGTGKAKPILSVTETTREAREASKMHLGKAGLWKITGVFPTPDEDTFWRVHLSWLGFLGGGRSDDPRLHPTCGFPYLMESEIRGEFDLVCCYPQTSDPVARFSFRELMERTAA